MPFTIPSGRKVVIAGHPIIEEFTVEAGTGVKPGRLVKKGTDADDVIVLAAATDKPSGWVGWDGEGTHPEASPATRDTAYATGKLGPVFYGPGTILVGKLASGQNVTKDTPLIPAANGELQAAANISATVPSGASPVTSTSAQPSMTMAGSFPPGGMIVALAKQNCNASGGALDIIIENLI
jgi:hypothetical protein